MNKNDEILFRMAVTKWKDKISEFFPEVLNEPFNSVVESVLLYEFKKYSDMDTISGIFKELAISERKGNIYVENPDENYVADGLEKISDIINSIVHKKNKTGLKI